MDKEPLDKEPLDKEPLDKEPLGKAPLTEHLGELRSTIVYSIIAILVTFMASFYYSENIFSLLTAPLHNTVSFSIHSPYISFHPGKYPDLKLIFIGPAEAVWMHIKISFISAFIVSSPIIFYQIWRFIAPGLLDKEKKYAIPFVFTTTFLFLLGSLFCFIIILPFAMNFLLSYKTENLQPMLSVGNYIDFCMKFIISFGVIFELPVCMVFLTKMGIVTPEFLAKNRKYSVLIAFVLAAVLTPTPDAFNQTLMAIPIIILYETGILASRLLAKKKPVEEEAE